MLILSSSRLLAHASSRRSPARMDKTSNKAPFNATALFFCLCPFSCSSAFLFFFPHTEETNVLNLPRSSRWLCRERVSAPQPPHAANKHVSRGVVGVFFWLVGCCSFSGGGGGGTRRRSEKQQRAFCDLQERAGGQRSRQEVEEEEGDCPKGSGFSVQDFFFLVSLLLSARWRRRRSQSLTNTWMSVSPALSAPPPTLTG